MSTPAPQPKKRGILSEVAATRQASSSDRMATDVTAYLLSGPAFFAFLGWVISARVGMRPLFMVLGVLLGMTLSMYLVWLRYGRPQTSQDSVPATRRDQLLGSERPTGPTDRSTKENL